MDSVYKKSDDPSNDKNTQLYQPELKLCRHTVQLVIVNSEKLLLSHLHNVSTILGRPVSRSVGNSYKVAMSCAPFGSFGCYCYSCTAAWMEMLWHRITALGVSCCEIDKRIQLVGWLDGWTCLHSAWQKFTPCFGMLPSQNNICYMGNLSLYWKASTLLFSIVCHGIQPKQALLLLGVYLWYYEQSKNNVHFEKVKCLRAKLFSVSTSWWTFCRTLVRSWHDSLIALFSEETMPQKIKKTPW